MAALQRTESLLKRMNRRTDSLSQSPPPEPFVYSNDGIEASKSRSKQWLLRFIKEIYHFKMYHDKVSDRDRNNRATMGEFMMENLKVFTFEFSSHSLLIYAYTSKATLW